MKFENRGKWLNQIQESAQKNEATSIDDLSTKEIANYLKTLDLSVPKNSYLNTSWVADKLQKHFNLKYKPTSLDIAKLLDAMPKEYLESAQTNESIFDYFYAAVGDAYASALDKGKKLSRDELKAKATELLKQRWHINNVDANTLEQAIKAFKGESAQVNESRNYTITVKASFPDNMNNRDVEDRVEELLDKHGFTVIDITANRKSSY